MTDIFAGFEEVQDMPQGAVVLAYGVNVIRIDAEVTTPRTETVGGLMEQYRSKIGIPADAVIFIDGVKVGAADRIPASASRIEIVKPAGEKGSNTPIIPLEDEAACTVEVYARIAVKVVRRWIEEIGSMSAALLDIVTLPEGAVVNRDGETAIVALAKTETVAERSILRQTAAIRRRLPFSLNEAWVAWPGHEETLVNDEPTSECRQLEAGDRLTIVVAGGEEEVPFDEWASQMHAQANWQWNEAMEAEHEAIRRRQAELEAMSFLSVRAAAKAAGIPASGVGRTREVLVEAILAAMFATADRQSWIGAWLEKHAPEAIGWEPTAPDEWDDDEGEEPESAAPSSGNSRW